MGYKVLGYVVWKSWLRLLGYKKRDAKARLAERRVLIGAGVALSAFGVAAAVALARRDSPE